MALSFNGTSDYVDHGDIAGVDGAAAFSVALWAFRSAAVAVKKPMLAKTAGTSWLNSFAVSSGEGAGDVAAAADLAFYFNSSSAWTLGYMPAVLAQAEWRWYGWVYDGSLSGNANRLKGWHGGASQTLSFTGTVPATLPDSGAGPVQAGRHASAGYVYGDWTLALVKAWLAALTPAQIVQEMHSYRPARAADLILWSPYDDGVSARDYSGTGNHGTVTGATQVQGPPGPGPAGALLL